MARQTAPLPEVVIPVLKRRFSGIASTILQVLPRQRGRIPTALVGKRLEGADAPRLSWNRLMRVSKRNLPGGYPIIFHARRNDDMIVGLLLKRVLRRRLHLVFTSVAQRRHTTFTRFLYRNMDTVLSTSERSASYLTVKPAAIVPHGVDTELYRPAEDRARAWREGGLPGERGIGIFGRVRPQKGIPEFVEAMLRVLPERTEYTAVIVGEITSEHAAFAREMKAWIARRGLSERFVWLGKLPFSEIPLWFRRMSLVVAASRNEGFGLTCLEAMASGAPVVATRTGGFEMVVRPEVDGFLAPCADPAALARAVGEALADPGRLEAMGRAARLRVLDAFTVEREARDLVAQYRRSQRASRSAAPA